MGAVAAARHSAFAAGRCLAGSLGIGYSIGLPTLS